MSTRRRVALACLLVVTMAGLWGARELGPGLAFLAALDEAPSSVAATAVDVEAVNIPSRHGPIPARWYRPSVRPRRSVVVIHGVHKDGYDEVRLRRFAGELARRGDRVLTPDVASLRDFSIELGAIDAIEDTVRFVLDSACSPGDLAPALVGISFSGGLALVAAARPAVAGRLSSVFSFGGHADLLAVQQYLVDGRLDDGTILTPHPYGQAVLTREVAAQLVPPAQVEPLREALLAFLRGESETFSVRAAALTSPAHEIVEACRRWDAGALGRLLASARLEPDPRLSPVRGTPPATSIYLLHGSIDNVIPPSQARALALWASARATTLVSPLISHVELGRESDRRTWLWHTVRLARFLSAWLRA